MAIIAGAVVAVGAVASAVMGSQSQKAAQKEMKRQRELAQKQLDFAKEQWGYYLDTYGDITNLMVADAMQTEVGDYDGAAGRAAVDVASQYQNQRDATERQMFSYGLDPSSGRFQSQDRSLGAQEALSSVMVQNQSRQAEKARTDALNQQKRQAIGMFGQQQINRGENVYSQAMTNMQNVMQGNINTQTALANNLFSNAGQFAGMGVGMALNNKNPQQPNNWQPVGSSSAPTGGLYTGHDYTAGFNAPYANNNFGFNTQAKGLMDF